jgi:hypothetical protein
VFACLILPPLLHAFSFRLHGSSSSGTAAAAAANFGVKGVPSAATLPLPRYAAGSGTVDSTGRMWMWAGHATVQSGSLKTLNDLFYYTPSLNFWCWVAGDAVTYKSSFGQFRVPSLTNLPARGNHSTSIDIRTSKLYMFGGSDNMGSLSDVQQFDIATGKFTWVSGSAIAGDVALYPNAKQLGTVQTHGRGVQYALMWVDPSGGEGEHIYFSCPLEFPQLLMNVFCRVFCIFS